MTEELEEAREELEERRLEVINSCLAELDRDVLGAIKELTSTTHAIDANDVAGKFGGSVRLVQNSMDRLLALGLIDCRPVL